MSQNFLITVVLDTVVVLFHVRICSSICRVDKYVSTAALGSSSWSVGQVVKWRLHYRLDCQVVHLIILSPLLSQLAGFIPHIVHECILGDVT